MDKYSITSRVVIKNCITGYCFTDFLSSIDLRKQCAFLYQTTYNPNKTNKQTKPIWVPAHQPLLYTEKGAAGVARFVKHLYHILISVIEIVSGKIRDESRNRVSARFLFCQKHIVSV